MVYAGYVSCADAFRVVPVSCRVSASTAYVYVDRGLWALIGWVGYYFSQRTSFPDCSQFVLAPSPPHSGPNAVGVMRDPYTHLHGHLSHQLYLYPYPHLYLYPEPGDAVEIGIECDGKWLW